MLPFRKPTAYITLPCATALACVTSWDIRNGICTPGICTYGLWRSCLIYHYRLLYDSTDNMTQRVERPRKCTGCHWNIDDTLSAGQCTVYFRLSGRHLWFITAGYFRQRWRYVKRVKWPRNYVSCHWNFDDTYSASQCTVYFRFSGRHVGFITSGYFRQRLQYKLYVQRVERRRTYRASHRNFDDTLSASLYPVCFRFSSHLVGFITSVTSDNVGSKDYMSSELIDLGIMGVAIGISTIWSLEDEILEPALKVDHQSTGSTLGTLGKTSKTLCGIGISPWYLHQSLWKW